MAHCFEVKAVFCFRHKPGLIKCEISRWEGDVELYGGHIWRGSGGTWWGLGEYGGECKCGVIVKCGGDDHVIKTMRH